ncbi:MAG: toluene tolerance protein [Rhodospirillaceae bacterium]|nr:toluene tolerance protein [Rhodospirillaceae bacterium]
MKNISINVFFTFLILFLSQFVFLNFSNSAEKDDAQKFIQSLGNKAIAMLSNKNSTKVQKISDFEKLLDEGFEVQLIARYALGKYWRKTQKDKKDEYILAFRKFIIDSYASRLGQFGGEKFSAVGVREDGKRGFIVNSLIETPNGTKVKVDWRVKKINNAFRIYDVVIEGISMVITQRDEFSSIIQRSGGNIDPLIKKLQNF